MKIFGWLIGLVTLFRFFDKILAGEYDLTIEVSPGKHQCFFQTLTDKHKSLEIDYQVRPLIIV